MTDQELIQAAVKKGLLTQSIGSRLLEEVGFSQKPVEEVVYAAHLINEETVAQLKSELLGIPYKKIDPFSIKDEVLKIISKETSQNYKFIPLERTKDMLVVGMLRPDDVRAQDTLRFIAKQNKVSLGVYLVTPSDLAAVWRRYVPYHSEVEAALKEIGSREAEGPQAMVKLEEGGRGEEAPIIKIIALTLKNAVEMGASDIHIEPQRTKVRIRFRIDGKLQEMSLLPLSLAQPLVSRVKVLARLKLDESRIPQDGRFRTILLGRDIDYRVSTFPTPSGEKVAIRVLDPSIGLKGLNTLGLGDYNYHKLEQALSQPFGMVLITGPTGSGKTTTLYAIMQKLNSPEVNILSLEDPVEYFIDGINQSQVKPEIGYDFASGLRQILRQDPDIVMVGEIRDSETASLAVNAALTGHILLSTLHTNNSLGVIPRLIDLGVPPFLLPSALSLIFAQRLVLRLCPHCKKEEEASPLVQKIIEESLKTLSSSLKASISFKPPYKIYHPQPDSNCKICQGKGTAGRVALFEIFQMTRELGDLIGKGFTEGQLWDEARRQEMVTLRQDGILKALSGDVLMEEVLRETASGGI